MASERLNVILQLTANQYKSEARQAARSTGQITSSADQAGSATGRMGDKMRGAGAAAKTFIAGAAVAAVTGFARTTIAAASDLQESLNAVNVTFGEHADGIRELGEEAATALGVSNAEFNSHAVSLAAFVDQIAADTGDVVGVMDDITTRASDFASVMNLEVDDALTKFRSGLAGESEPLRRFGIDVSAAAVQSFALANGITEAGSEMSEAEKVQARYGLIMEQTAKTAGDFANTSDDLANSQRIMNAELEDTKAEIGEELLPIWTDMVNGFSDALPVLTEVAGVLSAVTGSMDTSEISGWARAVELMVNPGRAAERAAQDLGESLFDASNEARGAAADMGTLGGEMSQVPDKAKELSGEFGTLGGEMSQIPPGVGDYFRNIGDEAGTAAPDIHDMADAVRDVARAQLEATDPAFAAIAAQQRAREAEGEFGDTLQAFQEGEASWEDVNIAASDAAEAILEAEAANAEVGANADKHMRPLQDALQTLLEDFDGVNISASDLLETLEIIDANGDIVFRIDVQIDPADQALLNGIASGRLGGPEPSRGRQRASGRQHGGTMQAHQMYRVGEGNRPELFMVPGQNGQMFSNSESQKLIAALSKQGGSDINVTLQGSGDVVSDFGTIVSMAGVMRRVETARR